MTDQSPKPLVIGKRRRERPENETLDDGLRLIEVGMSVTVTPRNSLQERKPVGLVSGGWNTTRLRRAPVYDPAMIFADRRDPERKTLVRVPDVPPCPSVSPGGLCPNGGNRGPADADRYGDIGIAGEDHLCLADEGIV